MPFRRDADVGAGSVSIPAGRASEPTADVGDGPQSLAHVGLDRGPRNVLFIPAVVADN